MKCPFCGADETAVADTRLNDEGDLVRRRRKCNVCDKRFTTYERAEIRLPQVVKKNGSRTEFSRDKLRASLELALRKRPVSTDSVDAAIAEIEEKLLTAGEREITSQQVGELVMRELRSSTRWPTSVLPRSIATSKTWMPFPGRSAKFLPTKRKNEFFCRRPRQHGPCAPIGRARLVDDFAQSAGGLRAGP